MYVILVSEPRLIETLHAGLSGLSCSTAALVEHTVSPLRRCACWCGRLDRHSCALFLEFLRVCLMNVRDAWPSCLLPARVTRFAAS